MAAVDRVLPWRRHQNATAEELTPLLTAYRRRHPKAPVSLINRAYETAREAHRHQVRGSGESYINHPMAVARIVADLGLDEISRARSFDSADEREAHLLRLLEATLDADGHPKLYLLEEAREVDWTDEQILEALALVALNEFQSLVANAGGLPIDQIDAHKLPDAA